MQLATIQKHCLETRFDISSFAMNAVDCVPLNNYNNKSRNQ